LTRYRSSSIVKVFEIGCVAVVDDAQKNRQYSTDIQITKKGG